MRAIPEIDDEEHLAIIDGGFSSQLSAELTSRPVAPPSAPKPQQRVDPEVAKKRLQDRKRKSTSSATNPEDHEDVDNNNSVDDDFQAPKKLGKHQIIEHFATKAIYLF
jgi:hypothetical protein